MHAKKNIKSKYIILSITVFLLLISLTTLCSNNNSAFANNNVINNDETSTTFNTNGGTFPDGTTSIKIEQTVGENYVLPPTKPIRKGYVFAGWYSSIEGGAYISSDSKVLKNVYPNAYAHWEKYVTFSVIGGLGHWCFLRHYVDIITETEQYEEMYSWEESFPVGSTFKVDKATGKLFMLNLTSETKIFMYDIIPVSYATFPIEGWLYNGEKLIPDQIYNIDDTTNNITIKAQYDYSKNGVPVTINSNEGISTFEWTTYVNGNYVNNGSLFPLKDISVTGSTLKIDENGNFIGTYNQPEYDITFSETIKPVLKDGYKFISAELSDGTPIQLNKVYTLSENQKDISIVYKCEKNLPQENIVENTSYTAQTYDKNNIAIITLFTILMFSLIVFLLSAQNFCKNN